MTDDTGVRIYCDDCAFLSITEQEQNTTKQGQDHFCYQLGTILKHHGKHPHLPRPEECESHTPRKPVKQLSIDL